MAENNKNFLRIYRMGIVLATVLILFYFHHRKAALGKVRVTLQEVKKHLKNASSLKYSANGIKVFDASEKQIGTAYTTSPESDKIKGYAGPTDSLIVIDASNKILGVSLRSSGDTPGHVEDVKNDYEFIERWQGMNFLEIAETKNLQDNEIWAVSGATRTSECMAWGLIEKSRAVQKKSSSIKFKFKLKDSLVILVLILALVLTFTKIKEDPKWRTIFRWIIFALVVFFGMDLLCLALFGGWSKNGLPIYEASVLCGFVILMFIIPWTTRKQIYCQQICPHGLVQETMAKLIPSKYSLKISKELKWALKFIPGFLLVLSLIVLVLELPLELSDTEVFSAWYPTRASTVCIVLFVLSLLFSAFVPKGYCKYACPTGRLLEYVRYTGKADRFTLADIMAGVLFLFLVGLIFLADKIERMLL